MDSCYMCNKFQDYQLKYILALFDMGGHMMPTPPNVFDHCAQRLRLSGVTIATSLSGSTPDFLKISFHMFAYNENLKVFKSKI